ncbi:MAG: KAP family NTPase, partial [Micrococcales bacterium]|nr:KAP family NTPase [Micrococcales bacterium]
EREGQGSEKKPLIIFVDNLDRCPSSVVVDLLEQIRVFMSMTRCVFVIAVDDQALTNAFADRYPDDIDPDEIKAAEYAEQYLEKMIQYPFTLPRLGETRIREFARDVLTEVGFVDAELIQVNGVVGPVVDERRDVLSLRLVVRLANALVVNHVVAQGELGGGSQRYTDQYDLRVTTLATVIQHFYPEDYRAAMSRADGPDYLWRELLDEPYEDDPQLFAYGAVQLKAYVRELAADDALCLDSAGFARYLRYLQPVDAATPWIDEPLDIEPPPPTPIRGQRPVDDDYDDYDDEPMLALRGHNEWYYDKMPQHLVAEHIQRDMDDELMDDAQTARWLVGAGAAAVGHVVTIGGVPWRVLEVENARGVHAQALLLAEYIQGRSQWHDDKEASLWGDDPGPWLRRELNGRFFDALPEHMQIRIPDTTWVQPSKRYGTKSESVQGHISLLSIEEVGRYLRTADARRAIDPWGNASWWWLRSPGVDPAYVDRDGNIVISGGKISSSSGGVRPVLRLSLE